MNKFLISLVFITFISVLYAKETQKTDEVLSCIVEKGKRKECGTYSSDQDKCEKNGCCWKKELFVPWCFKPISIKTKIVEDRAEDEDNSEASSETGMSIQDIIDKKFKKIENDIDNGKTEFKKFENDFLNSFSKFNNKVQNYINEKQKRVVDFWKNWKNFYFPENIGARKK